MKGCVLAYVYAVVPCNASVAISVTLLYNSLLTLPFPKVPFKVTKVLCNTLSSIQEYQYFRFYKGSSKFELTGRLNLFQMNKYPRTYLYIYERIEKEYHR